MFELQVALKYLVPRKKSLSTALISALSVLVVSLVIWLVLVFLSVTSGMEKNWLRKLTSLHAPLRIAPTEKYYRSFYYQSDALAEKADYALKTLGEKAASPFSLCYDESLDPEAPSFWLPLEKDSDGLMIDPVKRACRELENLAAQVPGFAFQDYEISGALLRIPLAQGTALSQMTYLLSFSERNPHLPSLMLTDTLLHQENHAFNPLLPPVFLPKSYQAQGVKTGDSATLSFPSLTAASNQEQKIRVQVRGFYDPGILAVGNKCVLVPHEITRSIAAASQTISPDGTPTNGFFVWFKDLSQTEAVAKKIAESFETAHISSYWNIATYRDFEFSKDLLLQFQSDRMLLLLIASIILVVACSNIVSLLVLLVNDKKKEIATLQTMGASFWSIASIFGFCGFIMGTLGCLFGSLAALATLRHIDDLVALLSYLQGHSAFQPAFFGRSLPGELSSEALVFVCIATPLLSLVAGMIPALKASRVHPSLALRSQ